MPTYDYKCPCGHEMELRQSIKDKPLSVCPACNQDTIYRVITGGADVFCSRGITTVGKQADVNATKMGKYRMSEIAEDNKLRTSGKIAFTDKEKRRKLSKKTPAQIEKYIMDGKL